MAGCCVGRPLLPPRSRLPEEKDRVVVDATTTAIPTIDVMILIPPQKGEEKKVKTRRKVEEEESAMAENDLDKHSRQGDGDGNGRGPEVEQRERRRRGRTLMKTISGDDDDDTDDLTDDVLSSSASTRQRWGLAGLYYYQYRYCEYWGIERSLGLWRWPKKANLAFDDNDERGRRIIFGPHRQPHTRVRSSYANINQSDRQNYQLRLSTSYGGRGGNYKFSSSTASGNIFFLTFRSLPTTTLLVLSLLMAFVLRWNPSSPRSIFDSNKNDYPQIYFMSDLFDVVPASAAKAAVKSHESLRNDVHHRHHHHCAAIFVSAFGVSPSIHIRIPPIRSRQHDRYYWIGTQKSTPVSKSLLPGRSATSTTTATSATGTHLHLYVDNKNQVDNDGGGDDGYDDDSSKNRPTPAASVSSSTGSSLFGKYADYVYDRLLQTGWLEPAPIGSVINSNNNGNINNKTTNNSTAAAENQSLTKNEFTIKNVASIPAELYQSNIGEIRRRHRQNERQCEEEKRSPTSKLTTTSLFVLNQPVSTIDDDDPATQNISNEENSDEMNGRIDDKGTGESVRITVRALQAPCSNCSNTSSFPLRYARIVLFETVRSPSPSPHSQSPLYDSDDDDEEERCSSNVGLQTLNIVVYPSYDHFVRRRHHTNSSRWHYPSSIDTIAGPPRLNDFNDATRIDEGEGDGDGVDALPIWGVSLVATSLKFKMPCMATIDAQPGEFYFKANSTSDICPPQSLQYDIKWDDWYNSNVNNNPSIPWGGRLRTSVTPFVSNGPPLLWTRFQNSTKDEAAQFMKTNLFHMMVEHLEIYLQHVSSGNNSIEDFKNINSLKQRRKDIIDYQNAYMDFWRYNEPERSTLRGLYGEEWSENLLRDILFPSIPSSSDRDEDKNKNEDLSM